ncbi:hypothetical protein TNCT_486181 [Trichonephila clavata]|uniref:Uncharacterized protein n=1 Tax=Trichonephila clavata TaxID=2740835 RepID=A0A8X6GEI4_TRICU|nr:hypothetical protein TNCT_486181 [Trichonephila clavata]
MLISSSVITQRVSKHTVVGAKALELSKVTEQVCSLTNIRKKKERDLYFGKLLLSLSLFGSRDTLNCLPEGVYFKILEFWCKEDGKYRPLQFRYALQLPLTLQYEDM